jgi:hypothetical protein
MYGDGSIGRALSVSFFQLLNWLLFHVGENIDAVYKEHKMSDEKLNISVEYSLCESDIKDKLPELVSALVCNMSKIQQHMS